MMPYHNTQGVTAVIGGICTSFQDLFDRVLLIDSILETAESIYLFGEIALAYAYSIGITHVGKVERTPNNIQDYQKLAPFLQKVTVKASTKNIQINLPQQVKVSRIIEFEEQKEEVLS